MEIVHRNWHMLSASTLVSGPAKARRSIIQQIDCVGRRVRRTPIVTVEHRGCARHCCFDVFLSCSIGSGRQVCDSDTCNGRVRDRSCRYIAFFGNRGSVFCEDQSAGGDATPAFAVAESQQAGGCINNVVEVGASGGVELVTDCPLLPDSRLSVISISCFARWEPRADSDR